MGRLESSTGQDREPGRTAHRRMLALFDVGGEYGRAKSGTSKKRIRKSPSAKASRGPLIASARERQAMRKRIGEFLRARRLELGLSQGDITRTMGYASFNAVSNLETGREGLPAKRIYAWADILQLPRDAFFRFATGETEKMEVAKTSGPQADTLLRSEVDLVETYRRLPPKYTKNG